MPRFLFSLLLFPAVLAGLLCVPAAATEILWVYPPPNSLIKESPTPVFGYVVGDPQPDLKAKVVYAESSAPPAVFPLYLFKGKVFSSSIELLPGRNNVVVGDAVLPLLFRPRFPAPREGEFREPLAHGDNIGSCNPCHVFRGGELLLKEEVPRLCLGCHQIGTESLRAPTQRNHHTRAVTPDCLQCHAAHASFEPKLMRSAANACLRCHQAYAEPSRHDLVSAQPCAACHDPHFSAYPDLLKGEPEALCEDCHAAIAEPERYPRSYHRPVEEGACFRCHTAHPSGNAEHLRKPIPILCRDCHPARESGGHTGNLEECRLCHTSHLSGKRDLLRDDTKQACVACHGDFGDGVSSHPALKEGCVECHNPHDPLAEGDSKRTCGRCHNLGDDDFKWVHGRLPINTARQCTFCHEPHRSDYPTLLRGRPHYPLNNGGCSACHLEVNGEVALRYEGSKNCTRCHGQITGTSTIIEADKVHKPVYQVDCIACHNPHLGVRESFLLEEPEVLCGWCHGLILRGVEHLHGVFKEGTCYTCHTSHISDFRPLLKQPEQELCLKCHVTILPDDHATRRRLHGVVAQGACTGCHQPHGADNPALLSASPDALCRGCHSATLKRADGADFDYLHGPVGAGTCTACHRLDHLHEQPGDGFLRDSRRAVCRLCHETPEDHVPQRFRAKMREVGNDCLACHVPHGADNPFLMKAGY